MDAIRASLRGAVSINEVPDETVIAVPPSAAPPAGGTTLEELVRSALAPVLKEWLDANLPEIVDRAARDEISRLTGRG
ncbi:DUF2497 domain-containing protein [Glacieibacterium frigidum]|uniref:DUF2497 domain-containing protein n=2 Tax=Glacieibacterium frigidum TaxID=2593303 RepID=A0A552UJJ9_9SPHN|nr:DUF2497 domain-containing protein [Glacieibacterium frigidum]